jgi:type I restriction enzyme S subunit
MNVQTFLKNFGYIANAPNGIKRLRELILQLAVTGTLTERKQIDTPVEELIRHNQKHRDRLITEKALRKQKPLPPINETSVPWILPNTWKWCRLGQVTSYGSTDKAEYSDVDPETWVLELEDIEKETSRLLSKVRAKNRRFRSSKNRFAKGQVLYGKLRPYLDKVLVTDEGGVCTTEIMPILPFEGVSSEYLRWYLKCPLFKLYANDSTHGMNLPRLGTEPARSALFAFPPIEEQKRIVAKVDELMALCDKLEAQQQERERRFPVLSRAHHTRFVESPTPANLRAIFDEANTVSAANLRDTILTLAILGKLSPQNKDDESSQLLLGRIEKERRQFAKENKFRMPRLEPINDRVESQLPNGWAWVRLNAVFNVITDGDHQPPPKSNSGIAFLTIGNITTGVLDLRDTRFVSESYYHSLAPYRRPLKGDILYTVVGATYGRPALVDTDHAFCVQRHIAILKPTSGCDIGYLMLLLKSPLVYQQATAGTTGTAQPTIPLTALRNFMVPLPPHCEQHRIVAKVDQLMALVSKLEDQQRQKDKVAEAFAQAAVSAITGTEIKEQKGKMKAPKTELVSRLLAKSKPRATDQAPLANLLAKHKSELAAKALWQQSGLEIDAFYQQLKTEMAQGWIIEPEKARMTEIEAD